MSKYILAIDAGTTGISFPLLVEHEEIEKSLLSSKAGGEIAHPSVMIKAKSLWQIGGYDEEKKYAQDLDLFLRLAEIGKLSNIPEILLMYRLHLKRIGYSCRKEQLKYAQI